MSMTKGERQASVIGGIVFIAWMLALVALFGACTPAHPHTTPSQAEWVRSHFAQMDRECHALGGRLRQADQGDWLVMECVK